MYIKWFLSTSVDRKALFFLSSERWPEDIFRDSIETEKLTLQYSDLSRSRQSGKWINESVWCKTMWSDSIFVCVRIRPHKFNGDDLLSSWCNSRRYFPISVWLMKWCMQWLGKRKAAPCNRSRHWWEEHLISMQVFRPPNVVRASTAHQFRASKRIESISDSEMAILCVR